MFTSLGASEYLSVFFNGKARLYQNHQQLKFGQPIWGNMNYGRFATAPFFIHNLQYTNNSISFNLQDANDEQVFSDLTISYLIVEKEADLNNKNIVRYIHNENFSITTDGSDQSFSHTTAQSFSGDNYKAVVLIRNSSYNILQAASTDRVLKPFRVATNASFSIVGATSGEVDYGYFSIINTDFAADYTIDINVQNIDDNMPDSNWRTSFCDHGSCYAFGFANVTIPAGSYYDFHGTIYPSGTGNAQFRFVVSANEHTIEFPHYFSTNDVDILIIQDDSAENTENIIIDALSGTGLSYGIYKPAYGNINVQEISNIQNIIWNVPSIFPDFKRQLLSDLGIKIQNGTNLLVSGQIIANSLSNNSLSAYSNSSSQTFLSNILNASFVENNLNNFSITGNPSSFANGIAFDLINDNTAFAHYSDNNIAAMSNCETLFTDNQNQVKGVYSEVILGKSVLLDFDINSINDDFARRRIFNSVLTWFDNIVSESDLTESIIKPVSLNIYPNPAKSLLNITFESEKQNNSKPVYSVYNVKGQKVYSAEMKQAKNGFNSTLDLNNLQISSGIYFIKISDSSISKISKVLILKD